MLRPPLSRFHRMLAVALLLAVMAVATGNRGLLLSVASALALLIGLGVALPQLQMFGPFLCRGATGRRQVALTFDDGPDARSTPALLDLLREKGVPAAFFGVGGKVAANPQLAARIVREGHLLENHSYAHSHLTNFFSTSRLRIDLEKTQAAIREATGVTPTLFRPPMGLSNPRVFAVARALGLRVIGWSARGLDTVIRNPDRVVARIVRRLQPGGIVLLHDGNIPAEQLLMTVRGLLTSLHEHGYEVVRLDKLLE